MEKITVWVDKISEPGRKRVIVSSETDDHSTTLSTYRYSRQMTAARAEAKRIARRRGCTAVFLDEMQH